jgi:deoxyribonuclease-4
MIRAGFHLSISGGTHNAAAEAADEGYLAFQIFVTNPRSWTAHKIPDDDAEMFIRLLGGGIPFAHLPYLSNPSSPNPETQRKSLLMLVENMENCTKLGIKELVVHLGSHLGKGLEYGKERAAETLAQALDRVGGVGILLENTAGYKNCVGSKISDLADIIGAIGSRRAGFCFDTCHAFAAGYDLTDRSVLGSLAKEITETIGKERLRLVHLNDAKFALGSGLDRHWHIGKGGIGVIGFKNLFSNSLFRSGSFVMETPVDTDVGHSEDMRALELILESCGLSANLPDKKPQ